RLAIVRRRKAVGDPGAAARSRGPDPAGRPAAAPPGHRAGPGRRAARAGGALPRQRPAPDRRPPDGGRLRGRPEAGPRIDLRRPRPPDVRTLAGRPGPGARPRAGRDQEVFAGRARKMGVALERRPPGCGEVAANCANMSYTMGSVPDMSQIRLLAAAIARAYDVDAVILFGSRARGTA